MSAEVFGAAMAAMVGLFAVRDGRLLGRGEALVWGLALLAALVALPTAWAAATVLFSCTAAGLILWFGQAPAASPGTGTSTATGTTTGRPLLGGAGPIDILLLMPALNEAESLAQLLPQAPKTVLGHPVRTLVVDDGSTDDTAAVAARLGAFVVRSPVNRGGGHALRLGFAAARAVGARHVVTLDADGQHRFEDLPVLLAPLLTGDADLVVGSRRLGRSVGHSAVRSVGVDLFNLVLGALLGRRVTDCASGYRAIRGDILGRLPLEEDRHHTAELLLLAEGLGLRVAEAPIVIVPRAFGESRKGTTIRYACRFACSVARSWARASAISHSTTAAPGARTESGARGSS